MRNGTALFASMWQRSRVTRASTGTLGQDFRFGLRCSHSHFLQTPMCPHVPHSRSTSRLTSEHFSRKKKGREQRKCARDRSGGDGDAGSVGHHLFGA